MTHTSSIAKRELREACKSVGIIFTTLKNPCETRWNSQHMNMKSVLKLKPALQKLFREDLGDIWSSRELTASEWKLLQGAVEILEEVLLVTKAWEVETEPTINCVLEQIYNLTSKLEDFIADPLKCRLVNSKFSKTKKGSLPESITFERGALLFYLIAICNLPQYNVQ